MSNAYQIGDKVKVTYLCQSQRPWLRQLAAFDAEVLDINETIYKVQYEHNLAKLTTTEDRLLPRKKANAPAWVSNAWGNYESISISSQCLTIPFEDLLNELEHIIRIEKANLKKDRVIQLRISIEQPLADITLELNKRVVYKWYHRSIKRSELLTKLRNATKL